MVLGANEVSRHIGFGRELREIIHHGYYNDGGGVNDWLEDSVIEAVQVDEDHSIRNIGLFYDNDLVIVDMMIMRVVTLLCHSFADSVTVNYQRYGKEILKQT